MLAFGRSIHAEDGFFSMDSSGSDAESKTPSTSVERDSHSSPAKSRTRSRSQSRARAIASKMVNMAHEAVSPRKPRARCITAKTSGSEAADTSQRSLSSNGTKNEEEHERSPVLVMRPAMLSPPSILNLSYGSIPDSQNVAAEKSDKETLNSVKVEDEKEFNDSGSSLKHEVAKNSKCPPQSPAKKREERQVKHPMKSPHRGSRHGRRMHTSFSDFTFEPERSSPRKDRKSHPRSKKSDDGSIASELHGVGGKGRTQQSARSKENSPTRPIKQSSRARYEDIVKDADQWRNSHLSRKLQRAKSSSEREGFLATDDTRSVSNTVIGLVTPSRTKRGTGSRMSQGQAAIPGIPRLLEKEEIARRLYPDSPRQRSKSRASSRSRSKSSTKPRIQYPSRESSAKTPTKEPRKKIKASQQPETRKQGQSQREIRYQQRSRTPTRPVDCASSIASTRSGRPERCPMTPGRTTEQSDVTSRDLGSVNADPAITPASARQRSVALSQEMKNGLLAGIKQDLEARTEKEEPKTPVKSSGLLGRRSKSVGRKTPTKASATPKILKGLISPRKESRRCVEESKATNLQRKPHITPDNPSPQAEKGLDLRKHIVQAASAGGDSLSGKTKESTRTRQKSKKKPRNSPGNVHAAAQLKFDKSSKEDLDVSFLLA